MVLFDQIIFDNISNIVLCMFSLIYSACYSCWRML